MKTVPVIEIETPEGKANVPASPLPVNAVRIECDGDNYVVYEEGDE